MTNECVGNLNAVHQATSVNWQQETLLYDRPHRRLASAARQLQRMPGRRLLDVGCATAHLRHLLPPDFVYYGCDISDRAAALLPPDRFLQMDFNQSTDLTRFNECRIDTVHIGGVLEYLYRPFEVLSAVRQILEPGGLVLVSMINFDSPRYHRCDKRHRAWIYTPSQSEFEAQLTANAWDVVERLPIYRSESWLASFRRILRLTGSDEIDQHFYVCRTRDDR